MSVKKITEKQMQDLYKFLAEGTCPKGLNIKSTPKLGKNKAFAVIYYLQEHLRILPDTFEKCCSCKEIFDSDIEGDNNEKALIDGRHYCGRCC